MIKIEDELCRLRESKHPERTTSGLKPRLI